MVDFIVQVQLLTVLDGMALGFLRFISFAVAAVGLFWATLGMPEACGEAEGDVSIGSVMSILRTRVATKLPDEGNACNTRYKMMQITHGCDTFSPSNASEIYHVPFMF